MQYLFNNPGAAALVKGSAKAPQLFGRVEFYQKYGSVLVVANISGLPQNQSGFYGFHIHEGGACTGHDFEGTLGHYNPKGTKHPNHAGDLPPLMLCGKMAHLEVLTDRFTLQDIIGKTVVIHSEADDFTTQPAGNAGTKIACGVIKRI